MNQDDGGRRLHVIALDQTVQSPQHCLDSLGTTSFAEPQSLTRHGAEYHGAEDTRQERHAHGHVPWRKERRVPDVGGLGWRTKSGHLLKNQAFFSQLSNVNKWDHPTHAGVNTWQEWHGPRTRTDADIMERLDKFDAMTQDEEARKLHVNTMRVETLDRFYNRKLNRSQYESASSWAPHQRARKEVHDSHDLLGSNMDEKPEGELKKVFTSKVMQMDRDGIRVIADRIQQEETWKHVWTQMEQERRQDIMADLQMRQAHTDMLMQMSGQPLREQETTHRIPQNCSDRTHDLAKPREMHKHKDVTRLTDFRGMVHADNEAALEAMEPGFGHEYCMKFRENATKSIEAGWPKPARAETPKRNLRKTHEQLAQADDVHKFAIPSSAVRIEKSATRRDDVTLKGHSKAQFLPTKAPPAPSQSKSLLSEDFSPATSMRDPMRSTHSNFLRTEPGTHRQPTEAAKHSTPMGQALGHAPPARRQYVYPVVVPASPMAKAQVRSCDDSANNSNGPSPKSTMRRNGSAPAFGGFASPASTAHDAHQTMRGFSPKSSLMATRQSSRQSRQAQKAVSSVCKELDEFEGKCQPVPVKSNFFNTPRKSATQGS